MTTNTLIQSTRTEENKVLKNTFSLLTLTLMWSALVCAVSSSFTISTPMLIAAIVAELIILVFCIPKTQNSGWGLFWVFAFTGISGMTLSPVISKYMATAHGQDIVLLALVLTASITTAAAGYAMNSKKDFSYMGAGLLGALLALIVLSVANIFLQLPMLELALSFGGALLFSVMILFDVSRIIHGGEKNYISATISLYLDIINLFMNMLRIGQFLLGASDD